MKRNDDLFTVNCPVCGRKLLRTRLGEIEIQCPRCGKLLLAGVDESGVAVYIKETEEKEPVMMVAEHADDYKADR